MLFFSLLDCLGIGSSVRLYCDNTPSPTEYINFFETISILAGYHLVVLIGVSHISLRHKKYNQESGRNEQRTNEGLG